MIEAGSGGCFFRTDALAREFLKGDIFGSFCPVTGQNGAQNAGANLRFDVGERTPAFSLPAKPKRLMPVCVRPSRYPWKGVPCTLGFLFGRLNRTGLHRDIAQWCEEAMRSRQKEVDAKDGTTMCVTAYNAHDTDPVRGRLKQRRGCELASPAGNVAIDSNGSLDGFDLSTIVV